MAITLAHPSLANPTALVTLPDSESINRREPLRKKQNVFLTDAGGPAIVYDFGTSLRIQPMPLIGLDDAAAEALVSFFNNPTPKGVNGQAGQFQIQDTFGDISTVQFAMEVIEPVQGEDLLWSVNLLLRVLA